DGMLGTGSSVTATVSEGIHTVTATVTDAGGLAGTATVVVRVGTTNAPPAVTITAPPPGSSVPAGTRVTLTATAADDFDGDVAGAVQWSSDRDGPLGAAHVDLGPRRAARVGGDDHRRAEPGHACGGGGGARRDRTDREGAADGDRAPAEWGARRHHPDAGRGRNGARRTAGAPLGCRD